MQLKIKKSEIRYRAELGLQNSFVIGHIGRFSYTKNHDFLLSVFLGVLQKIDNSKLLLIGEGELYKNIKDKIQELNITDKVIMLGYRSDIAELLQAIDVFCLPSKFEGMPIVAIEAQSAGLKCILSDTITDEIKITNNLVQLPLNISPWIDSICEVADNFERQDMYDIITSNGFNIKDNIKEIERLYTIGVV